MSLDGNFYESTAFISENKISAYAEGELSGLTFAVKDNIDLANESTGYGSPSWAKTQGFCMNKF